MMLKKFVAISAGFMLSMTAFAAPFVEIQTSMGVIVIELDSEKAPKTVRNFLKYAKDGFYNGTIFHRVIEGFMIQGGGFSKDMREKTTSGAIQNEGTNGLRNLRGTIAMARLPDPHSATSQFFINHKDNSSQLDYPKNNGGYAVFGKVTQGLDVVDEIAKAPTGNHPAGYEDVPLQPILIQTIKILSDKK